MLNLIVIALHGFSPLIKRPHKAYTYLLLMGQHLDPPAHNFTNGSPFHKIGVSTKNNQNKYPGNKKNSDSKGHHSRDFKHEACLNRAKLGYAIVKESPNFP